MSFFRSALLKASESKWLAARLPNYPFARRAVRRFMPGETAEAALAECSVLNKRGLGTVITRLGENIESEHEARAVAEHYRTVLAEIQNQRLPTQVSVKLTQLGLDIDDQLAADSVMRLMRAAAGDTIWIDMEYSRYTDGTIDVFNAARDSSENIGVCVQAYLHRTMGDLEKLLQRTSAVRLVKGAYKESPAIAFARKGDVDRNYMKCARMMLERVRNGVAGNPPAFATHDVELIRGISEIAEQMGIPRNHYEFQMLYGIRAEEQQRLVREAYKARVLISYGEAWFAWYMRRLAERPANVWFVMKSML